MSAYLTITPEKLFRLLGSPKGPVLLGVRTPEDFDSDPQLVPGSLRREVGVASAWVADFAGRDTVVISQRGAALGPGVAAVLRGSGARAETLAGGFAAWDEAGLPLIPEHKMPHRDALGRTVCDPLERGGQAL